MPLIDGQAFKACTPTASGEEQPRCWGKLRLVMRSPCYGDGKNVSIDLQFTVDAPSRTSLSTARRRTDADWGERGMMAPWLTLSTLWPTITMTRAAL